MYQLRKTVGYWFWKFDFMRHVLPLWPALFDRLLLNFSGQLARFLSTCSFVRRSLLTKLFSKDVLDGRMLSDRIVQHRLRCGRLIHFVVAETAVANQSIKKVFVETYAVFYSK